MTLKVNDLLGIIEMTHGRKLITNELNETVHNAISLAKRVGIKLFLSDLSEWTEAPSILEIYYLPHRLEEERLDRGSRHALILPKSYAAREAAHFYETVCTNHGWCVKLFRDRCSAVHFLLHGTGC